MFKKTSFIDYNSNPFKLVVNILVIACFVVVLTKIIYSLIFHTSFFFVSAAWVGLAMDLKDGVFYRPLFSESTGFGGTRFFPLYFSIHALLMKLMGTPIISGYIISIISEIILFGACYKLLRKYKIELSIILWLLVLLLSTISIQIGFSAVRADILPLALNILGIFIFISDCNTKYKRILVSFLFILAFSAKITAVSGLVSVFIWLFLNKNMKEGVKILALTSIGYIIVIGIMYLGSSGRVIDIFASCASGNIDILSIINGPIRLAKRIIRYDLECVMLSFWALFIIYKYKRNLTNNLFFIFWITSIIITFFIFLSPGTETNHLVDISTASILLIGSVIFNSNFVRRKLFTYMYAIIISFAVIYNIFLLVKLIDGSSNLNVRYPEEIVDICRVNDGIILSEDPTIPVLANKKPYILDSFMLRILVNEKEDIKKSLINGVIERKYSVIIFEKDPLISTDRDIYLHYGEEFIEAVISNYTEGIRKGKRVVYFPDYSDSNIFKNE